KVSREKGPIILALGGAAAIAVSSLLLVPVVKGLPLDSGKSFAETGLNGFSETPHYVPSNLQPGLRLASEDAPSIHETGCHLGHFDTAPTPCSFGDDAKPSVRLFGDSHASSWSPALDQLAEDGEIFLEVNTKGSCPSSFIPVNSYGQCENWREAVLD